MAQIQTVRTTEVVSSRGGIDEIQSSLKRPSERSQR